MEDLTKELEDTKGSPHIPDISLDREHDTFYKQPPVRKTPFVNKRGLVRIEYREDEMFPEELELNK